MSDVQEYLDFKEQVENKRREADKASGRLEEAERVLKEKYDCDSLEAAEKLLTKMKKEESKAQKEFEKALDAYKEKWDE